MTTHAPAPPRAAETGRPPTDAERRDALRNEFERLVDARLAAPGGMRAILGRALTTAQRIVRQVGNIDARMGGARGTNARALAGDVLMAQTLLAEAHRILMNRLVAL